MAILHGYGIHMQAQARLFDQTKGQTTPCFGHISAFQHANTHADNTWDQHPKHEQSQSWVLTVRNSFPPKWYPCSVRVSCIACTLVGVDANAVASANLPFISAALPPNISSNFPTCFMADMHMCVQWECETYKHAQSTFHQREARVMSYVKKSKHRHKYAFLRFF